MMRRMCLVLLQRPDVMLATGVSAGLTTHKIAIRNTFEALYLLAMAYENMGFIDTSLCAGKQALGFADHMSQHGRPIDPSGYRRTERYAIDVFERERQLRASGMERPQQIWAPPTPMDCYHCRE